MADPTQLPRLPRFALCGLGEVRSRSRESPFTHVVSNWDVGTRGDGPAEVAAFFPASRLHQVRFDDVEFEAAGAVTRSMVRDILQFGAGLGPDDAVLVHCLAGVSRSAGAAYALACQYARLVWKRRCCGCSSATTRGSSRTAGWWRSPTSC